MLNNNYRERLMPMWRRATKINTDTPLHEVVKGLVAMGEPAEATQMLFGSDDRTSNLQSDRIAWEIYMFLWAGNAPDLIPQIVGNHHWSEWPETKGLSLHVYPGEYMVIHEPTATEVLMAAR